MNVTAEAGLSQIVGASSIRPAGSADLVDGAAPDHVVEPATPEAAAAVLAWCSTHRQSVVIRGGGSRMGWGRLPSPIALVLSTSRLSRIVRHEPGDLTVTAEAGMRIVDLNRELAAYRQWLPIDLRDQAGTIGGAIATNESGPLRHRYGTPRDQLIGIHLAMADGRLASAGGNVVKNVAGYDLGKLMAGSFGSLATVVSATFKLVPLPSKSMTLSLNFADADALSRAAAEIASSQIEPVSLDVGATLGPHGSVFRLLIRLAGAVAAVEEQAAGAEGLTASCAPVRRERLDGDAQTSLWHDWYQGMFERPGAILKASWKPADLRGTLDLLSEARAGQGELEFAGRGASGTGLIRLPGDVAAQASVTDLLRGRSATVDHVVIVRGDAALKRQVDVWGAARSSDAILRALKKTLDPAGILNAHRGPI